MPKMRTKPVFENVLALETSMVNFSRLVAFYFGVESRFFDDEVPNKFLSVAEDYRDLLEQYAENALR